MAVSTLIAFGMFGTTLFIPLFIQTVIGTSATKSGAVMMPMTIALVLSAMLTGQLITRLGRYRLLAVSGVALTAIGMFLIAQMDVSTTYAVVVRNLIVMGIGLGATMPVFTLAVQNAVDSHFVGVVTSTIQFMRSVGGALGAAVFGSILANRYLPSFHALLPGSVMSAISPEQLGQFNNPQMILHPGTTTKLQEALAGLGSQGVELFAQIQLAARLGLEHSLHDVFLIGASLLTLATALTVLVKDIPLRKTNRPLSTSTEINAGRLK